MTPRELAEKIYHGLIPNGPITSRDYPDPVDYIESLLTEALEEAIWPIVFSICHLGWTDEDFKRMWERLARENPPQKQDFTANRKIEEKLRKAKGEKGAGE